MGWNCIAREGKLYCNIEVCRKKIVLQYTLVYCNEAGLKAVEDCIAIQLLYYNLGRLQ